MGPYAIRYKEYKAHFHTSGSGTSDNPDQVDADCHKNGTQHHDPPLLFNLYTDPNERFNLADDPEYR